MVNMSQVERQHLHLGVEVVHQGVTAHAEDCRMNRETENPLERQAFLREPGGIKVHWGWVLERKVELKVETTRICLQRPTCKRYAGNEAIM